MAEEAKRKRNNLGDLAVALFGELDRLDACETAEEIENEVKRAKAVESLAGKIIENANTVIKAVQLKAAAEDATVGTIAPLPPMLGGGE